VSRRIALVEDEPALRDNVADALRRHGYDVAAYGGRDDALAAFRARLPDLALIDIGLADDVDGGFALCRELRALSATLPIIFLSARDSDFDIVAGLRLGADDYVTKDTSLPHLTARIAALFRRSDLLKAPPSMEDVITRGPLTLDVKRFTTSWHAAPEGSWGRPIAMIRCRLLAGDLDGARADASAALDAGAAHSAGPIAGYCAALLP